MKMKICILSAFEDSLARDTGYSVRIYNLAKNLVKLGNDVHIVLPQYASEYKEVNGLNVYGIRGAIPKIVIQVFGRSLGIVKSTFLYFYDFLFILRAVLIIRESDAAQIEQQPAGGVIIPIISKVLKKPVLVDCHDVFQARRLPNTSMIRRIMETLLEIIVYKCSNTIVVVSENEKKILLSIGIEHDKIKVVPNGVNTQRFTAVTDVSYIRSQYNLEDTDVVIFVGNMEYSPNKEAVELIAFQIAPLVRKEVQKVKFLIVGRTQNKINSPDLIYTGIVDNVVHILSASDVAIAPLLHGSGTRLKILEYFSCSLPVVSTTIGIEGLDVDNKVNVMIEDDLDKFANKIIMLLKNRSRAKKLGEAARELVLRKYDWINITRSLNSIYENILNTI